MIMVSLVISFLFWQFVLPGGVFAADGITNPLKATSISGFIADALKFVVNLLAIAGVVYIIWTGFMFVKAQGNPEDLKTAKQAFLNAIIGMAIILGAWAIATAIANTINQITNNSNVRIGT